MSKRLLITLSSATLLLGGVAFAQDLGTSTGPAAGKNVEPNAAIQKQEGRSVETKGMTGAGGAPGVEAKPGSEAGAAPNNSNSMGSSKSQ